MSEEYLNIYQRIAQVQKKVLAVAKDALVGKGDNAYRAVSHDKVMSLIRQPCIDAGVTIFPVQQAKGESVPGVTSYGKPKHRFEAMYDINFVCIDKPDDRLVVSIEAHGDDNLDKAPGKAVSYATKAAVIKVFMLATGENDEVLLEDGNGTGPPPATTPPPITAARMEEIERLMYECRSAPELTPIWKGLTEQEQGEFLDKFSIRKGELK